MLYAIVAVLALILVIAAVTTIRQQLAKKEPVLSLAFANVAVGEDLEKYLTFDFLRAAVINERRNEVYLYKDLYLSEEADTLNHEYAYASRMKVMGAVSAGRLDAVLMNREAYGRTTDIFCRMGLEMNNGEFVYVHPTFLYESLWNLTGFCFLSRYVAKGKRQYPGQCALLYFLWYGLGRVWIEGLRTDSLMLGSTGIRISQLLSLLLLLASAAILLIKKYQKKTV